MHTVIRKNAMPIVASRGRKPCAADKLDNKSRKLDTPAIADRREFYPKAPTCTG